MIGPRPPNIHISKEYIRATIFGFKIAKYRPWTRDLRRDIFHLMQMGIETKILRKNDDPKQLVDKDPNLKAIGFEHLASAFTLYAFILILACLAFCVEMGQCCSHRR